MITPTEHDYIVNVMFGTVSSDKFRFALFGYVSLLPCVTHFDFDICLN